MARDIPVEILENTSLSFALISGMRLLKLELDRRTRCTTKGPDSRQLGYHALGLDFPDVQLSEL